MAPFENATTRRNDRSAQTIAFRTRFTRLSQPPTRGATRTRQAFS
jgi:hypothetical protein